MVYQVLGWQIAFDLHWGHEILLRVERLAGDLLVLLNGDDFDARILLNPQFGSLSVSLIFDDVEGADVAAGDGSVEVLLQRVVEPLVDGH